MSRQYPIWVKNHQKSNKDFGVRNRVSLELFAGTSNVNSHHFTDIVIIHNERKDGLHLYELSIDGKVVKRAIYNEELEHFEKIKL